MSAQESFLVVAGQYYDDLVRDIGPEQQINLSDIVNYVVWVVPVDKREAARLIFKMLGGLGRIVDDSAYSF
jgi:hypothetical protein